MNKCKYKMGIPSFLTVIEFKELTGVQIDDQNIELSLIETAGLIKKSVFCKNVYNSRTPEKKFRLKGNIADSDFDGEVTVDDINIFEFDRDDFANPEICRRDNIVTFNDKYGMIEMDDYYPSDPKRELVIEYYTARFPNDEIKPYLKKLNLLMATQNMFTTMPIEKLQEGISSWSLNGVSISFDNNSINSIKQSLNKEAQSIIKYITPVVYDTTSIGLDRDDMYNSRLFGRASVNSLTNNNIRFR